MNDFFFWKKWRGPFRIFYWILLCIFAISLLFLITGWISGFNTVLTWKLIPKFDTVDISIDRFIHDLIRYTIDINTYLVKKTYEASAMQIHPLTSYCYFGAILIAFLFFITLLSYLDLFWYGLGMTAFTVFLVSLKTELLGIFGMENKVFLIVLLLLFLSTSYYFQAFGKNTRFTFRLTSFTILFLVAGFFIALFSKETAPFFMLANQSIPIPMILSIFFLFMTGYDLIFVFLYLSTSGKSINPKARLFNFLFISGLYLLNLCFLILKRMDLTSWNIFYLSPFALFIISAIVGIWVYRERLHQNGAFIKFYPHGAFLYLSLALMSATTIGFGFFTGNDPVTDMYEYMIIFIYLSFGVIFLLYVLLNFGDLFSTNAAIYKVAFRPRRVPHFIMTGIGLVMVLGLFLFTNKYPYFLAVSGYYNLNGDIYSYQGKNLLAKEYYKEGFSYAFQNQKSNYSLADLALETGKPGIAQQYLTNSIIKNPSPYAYVRLSNLYKEAGLFFPAMFLLKDGSEQFPNNPQINNNLGLLFLQTSTLDSAYHFLQIALDNSDEEATPVSNMLTLLVTKHLLTEADSISNQYAFPEDAAFLNNKLVTMSMLGDSISEALDTKLLGDSILEGARFPYLYNFSIGNLRKKSFPKLKPYISNPENSSVKNFLLLLEALHKWYSADKFEAVKALNILKLQNTETEPYFSKILGMLLFKQKAYTQAASYLSTAHVNQKDEEALLYYSVSLLETGQPDSSVTFLSKLAESDFPDIRLIASNLLMIQQTTDLNVLKNWDDELRYQYLHFQYDRLTESQQNEIYHSITNENIHLLAAAELIKHNLAENNIKKANTLYEEVQLPQKPGNYFIGEFDLQYLKLLEKQKQWSILQNVVDNIYLNDDAKNSLSYFKARIAENTNHPKQAKQFYRMAIQEDPFNPEVFYFGGNFFQQRKKLNEAYDIFVEGLELYPDNVLLLKAYIKLALELNLRNFAMDIMEKLSGLISRQELSKFQTEIESQQQDNSRF